jgi:hypothetical protein
MRFGGRPALHEDEVLFPKMGWRLFRRPLDRAGLAEGNLPEAHSFDRSGCVELRKEGRCRGLPASEKASRGARTCHNLVR